MKIELDPGALRAEMKVWKDALDLKMPLDESSRREFVALRTELLRGFEETAASWLLILRSCQAYDSEGAALRALRAEIEQFQSWAMTSLEGIRRASGEPFQTSAGWRTAFCDEWCRLAEGKADPKQVLEWATELYKDAYNVGSVPCELS